MASPVKLETHVEIKSYSDRFYELLKGQHSRNIRNASPDKIHAVDVLESDWDTNGSVKLWKYTVERVVETFKEKTEIDEVNKKVTYVALGGNCLDHYKSYKDIFKVTPKSEGGGVVAITSVYEKRRNDSPEPHKYLQFLTALLKDNDAHLLKD